MNILAHARSRDSGTMLLRPSALRVVASLATLTGPRLPSLTPRPPQPRTWPC